MIVSRSALVLCLSFLVVLFSPLGQASAAVAVTGENVYAKNSLYGFSSMTCEGTTPRCIGTPDGKLKFTLHHGSGERFYVAVSTQDPRTSPDWPFVTSGSGAGAYHTYDTTPAPTGTQTTSTQSSSTGWAVTTATVPSTARFIWAERYSPVTVNGKSQYEVVAVWDVAPPAAPTTTTPPPTTTPPTTTAPSTTAPTTTPPPTTTEPAPGGTGSMTCTDAAPCPVRVVDGVTIDADSINVSALTEEQWATIELGLGAVVFFSGAAFVASWRHGRGG